jgi:uncharacterized membrane protein YraQ (UPF0718 family)
LNILYVVYPMFLFGSLAFGLEAMLIGLGGQLPSLYRRDRKRVLKVAFLVGLCVVGLSIVTSTALDFGPVYFCAFVLVYTLFTSTVLGVFKTRFINLELPAPPQISDEEIKQVLQKRGFDELVENKKD